MPPLLVLRCAPDEAGGAARLDAVLRAALSGLPCQVLERAEDLGALRGRRLLFALPLGEAGVCLEYQRLLARLRRAGEALAGSVCAIVTDGAGELYTKSAATELALALNAAGAALIGRPLVEGTGSLANFQVQASLLGCGLAEAYRAAVRELAERLCADAPPRPACAELLALHASNYRTSNTLQLWSRIRARLGTEIPVTEIGLRNGTLADCSGCPYTMCLHFGEKGRCFYGGVMQDEVYPAVRRCAALLLLCPNYNDALSANLTAFINRLTGLFRQNRFYDKSVFAIVVSGYSGGDLLARQIIGGLNMNKSFRLPPRFALIETANGPGEAIALPGIQQRLDAFAQRIRAALLPGGQSGQETRA